MRLIQSPRQSGKTTKCVEMIHKDPRYILLTFSQKEADRIISEYGVDPRQVMYWRTYAKRKDLHERTKPIVDNMDHVLNDVIGTWVEVGTLTMTEKMQDIVRFVKDGRKY